MTEVLDQKSGDQLLRELAGIVGAPAFILPWLDRFYSAAESSLVFAAAGGELPGTFTSATIDRAVRRAILDDHEGVLVPSTFHSRYELWALYEHWADIPPETRAQLNAWELAYYVEEVGSGIKALSEGRHEDSDQGDYTFLLLEEAEALVRSREAIYLWPCNCRAMYGACDKSHAVCLRFENDRHIGWEITPERAIEVLRQCDREGLMRTGYTTSTHGHHGICNCCSCCCFPIKAGEALGAEAAWPVRRHVAVAQLDACSLCGRCVKRCPFGAISINRRRDPKLVIDAAACRGCGVCATGCQTGAMSMKERSAAEAPPLGVAAI